MTAKTNIILVGFMGTGKTSVGRKLAAALQMSFLDMDDMIQQRAGKQISRIFAEEGEKHFRKLERELVCELCSQSDLIIATGGGVVLNPDNIRDFARSGLVVCLSATPEVILQRVGKETYRPLLNEEDKMGKIRGILSTRQHLYDAIPCLINTDPLSINQVVEQIMEHYISSPPQPGMART